MLRAAAIGLGIISPMHLDFLKSRDDVEIAGLCDLDPEALKKGIASYGGKGFDDYEKMIDEISPDAVWLFTPSTVRREPLLFCADRGIPVFCEKPAERREEEAARIAEELEERKARVQVGYVFRSMPMVEELRRSLEGDRIHAIQSFYRCGISLTRELPEWFYDKARSGGALVDQATHNFDLLRSLFGEVAEVRGMAANPVHPKNEGYTIDEVLSLSMRFENGAVCSHTHSWVADGWRNDMVLQGEKRIYLFDVWQGKLTVREGNRSSEFTQDQARMYDHQNVVFLDMVKSGKWDRNPCTYQDALKTLHLTLTCDRAIGDTEPAQSPPS